MSNYEFFVNLRTGPNKWSGNQDLHPELTPEKAGRLGDWLINYGIREGLWDYVIIGCHGMERWSEWDKDGRLART